MSTAEWVFGVIFAITAGAAIYYARQARAQVEQGEREFLPLAKASIHSFTITGFKRVLTPVQQTGQTTPVELTIAARILNGAIDIRCLLVNLSKGHSDFKLNVFPWLEYDEGERVDLRGCVSEGLYTGAETWVLYLRESIDGHFPISINDVIPINDFVNALTTGAARLHIELLLQYPENPKARLLYDHYYTGDYIQELGTLIEGDWAFAGRTEKPKNPNRSQSN